MTAASTSPRTLGSVAASISENFRFFGLDAISRGIASSPASALRVISPAASRRRSALPSLVGSLGIAIVAPAGMSEREEYFLE